MGAALLAKADLIPKGFQLLLHELKRIVALQAILFED
jgi:hypothetical protein